VLVDYKLGQASIVVRVKLRNSSVSTGAGLTGLTNASANLVISTIADNEATPTTYTVAGSTVETITTLGTFAAPTATKCRFKEVDATNHKGIYELQIADARFATAGAKSILISISGAANLAECDVVIPLRSVDPYSANGFMTGIGGKTYTFDANNKQDVNVFDIGGAGPAAPVTLPTNFGAFAIDANGRIQIQPGTGTGQVDLTTGRVKLVDGSITTATYTAGAITATVAPNLDAAVSSRSTYSGGAVTLSSSGLDAVVVETGINARQALALIGAATAGKASGLDTATAIYFAMGLSGTSTTRITATTTTDGNRTATTLAPPA
jgi:hypothetical protein